MIATVQFLQLSFEQPQTQIVMKKIATLLFSLALISVAANADDKPSVNSCQTSGQNKPSRINLTQLWPT